MHLSIVLGQSSHMSLEIQVDRYSCNVWSSCYLIDNPWQVIYLLANIVQVKCHRMPVILHILSDDMFYMSMLLSRCNLKAQS